MDKSDIISARHALDMADAILIGASNGLSISEGYNIFADNAMFRNQFGDFQGKYGVRSVLDACFSQNMSPSDREKFLRRLVELWYDNYTPSHVMLDLRHIIGDKPYFILTTNADEHLEKAGFLRDRIWEIEGTFRDLLSGDNPQDRYGKFIEFLNDYTEKKLVVLELGIGSRNRIIKPALMQLALREPELTYIILNFPHEINVPPEIESKIIALPGDIGETLKELCDCQHYINYSPSFTS